MSRHSKLTEQTLRRIKAGKQAKTGDAAIVTHRILADAPNNDPFASTKGKKQTPQQEQSEQLDHNMSDAISDAAISLIMKMGKADMSADDVNAALNDLGEAAADKAEYELTRRLTRDRP